MRGRTLVVAEGILSEVVERYGREILEVIDITVTVLTPAGTDLQEVHPVVRVFHEIFIAHDPTSRYGRERTPAFTTGEVRGTIRT